MQQWLFNAGDTSKSIDVFLPDSSSTTGAGLAALVFNSSGLKCYYRKNATGTVTAITLATQTVGGAWSSGGFVETDATNMKGVYRFDIPDTVLAAAGYAMLYFYGATNLAPVPVQIQVSAPVNVVQWNGTNVATPATAGIPDINVKNVNNVSASSVTAVNANVGTTQPINFTGTGASALVKSDMVDIAGAAVSTASAQIGVNVVNAGGTAWASGSLTSGVFAAGAINAAAIAADAIGASELAADAVAEIVTAMWTDLLAGSDFSTAASIGKLLKDNIDATISSRGTGTALDAAGVRSAVGLATNNLDTQLAALQADTDDIQTRLPAALSAGGFMMSDVEEVLGTAAQPTGITIRKNVALANFEFPMYDASDGKTLKSGLTITATMSLDGAAFAAMTNSASEVGSSGVYKINLAQADNNADTVTYMFDGGPTANVTIITFVTQP